MYTTDTSPPLPRERRREKTRRRILDTALDTVASGGLASLSLHKLAAALDYTPGALYRYFPNKDALVAHLVGEVIADIAADLARATRAHAPLPTIVLAAHAWRRFATTRPHRFALVSQLLAAHDRILTDDALAAPAVTALLDAIAPVAAAFAAAPTLGDLLPGPALDRALLLFAAIQGTLLLRKQATRRPDLIDVDRLFDAMLHTLLTGWGAPPDALALALAAPGASP